MPTTGISSINFTRKFSHCRQSFINWSSRRQRLGLKSLFKYISLPPPPQPLPPRWFKSFANRSKYNRNYLAEIFAIIFANLKIFWKKKMANDCKAIVIAIFFFFVWPRKCFLYIIFYKFDTYVTNHYWLKKEKKLFSFSFFLFTLPVFSWKNFSERKIFLF